MFHVNIYFYIVPCAVLYSTLHYSVFLSENECSFKKKKKNIILSIHHEIKSHKPGNGLKILVFYLLLYVG